MSAWVLETEKPPKAVKNLGWLLKNWKIVERFDIRKTGDFPNEGTMYAYCRGGKVFVTGWASLEICKTWLHRPVFIGIPVCFIGETKGGK